MVATQLNIPTCPVCSLPAHASESDDNNVHAECQRAFTWRILVEHHTHADLLLVEIRHCLFDEATDTWATERVTSILSADVSEDGSTVRRLDGPALVDLTEDELRDDMERWFALQYKDADRCASTRYYAEVRP